MDACYAIADTRDIVTPALVVFREIVEQNLREMIRVAGSTARLPPHCKTHKMPDVARMELAAGITKHKCATFAEAEMLAQAGVRDVFLAYNLVGANIDRAVRFRQAFSAVTFSCTADRPIPLRQLAEAMTAAGTTIDVLLDVDSGLHRTGVAPDDKLAVELYRMLVELDGLQPGGLHVYDGHNHQSDLADRTAAVNAEWQPVCGLRARLQDHGWPMPRIVAGGSGSFPVYAAMDDPLVEASPGTCVFHDTGYGTAFPDQHFQPAALLLTRVISRPGPDRLTCDLGSKAVASDPPHGQRLLLLDLPDAQHVLQNEEHLVVVTPRAEQYQPGDELLAVPRHICPTSALHKEAYVVANGELVDRWPVIARDRWLTI